MAICDSKLFFSRDVKVYIEPLTPAGATQGNIWEIPVLDGFSFAQANNSSEITLAEMESAGGVSRRGKRMFNDSLAPAEWSISTYTRPFVSGAGDRGTTEFDADVVANVHAVEEVLWALAAGAAQESGYGWQSAATVPVDYFTLGLTGASGGTTIDWNQSNVSTLGICNIYFVLEADDLTYKITNAVVNEATINFDIDGIAQIEWSGMGAEIVDHPSVVVATVTEGVLDTANFIRNRLTQLTVNPNKDAILTVTTLTGAITSAAITDGGNGYTSGGTILLTTTAGGGDGAGLLTYTIDANGTIDSLVVTTPGTTYDADLTYPVLPSDFPSHTAYTVAEETLLQDSYLLTLTGGSITLANNITYIIPEELGTVNIPIGHVTGNRSWSGSFTTYLVKDSNNPNESSDFWEDAKSVKTAVTHDFNLNFFIGGTTLFPRVEFKMPHCHIEIPTHSVEDVISLETSFSALGTCISSADEASIKYLADTVAV